MSPNVRRFSTLTVALVCAAASLRAGSFVLDPPSPSWPGSSDILRDRPGPVAALPRPGILAASLGLQAPDIIDALSDGRDPVDGERHPGDMHLIFSVSRSSAGLPGTAVRQERVADTVPPAGAQPNGHASDLFVWDGINGVNALAPPPLGWSLGSQTGDEANAHLQIPGAGQPGDDVHAYDRSTMAFLPVAGGPAFPPRPIFFSLENGSPTLAMIGATGGDVLAVGGPFGGVPVIFLPHAALGLPPWVDLDALDLEVHQNAAGMLAPWRVRYSVSNATLGFALPGGVPVNSGAHILASNAMGSSVIAIAAAQLGLRSEDDVDALESAVTRDGEEGDDDLEAMWIVEESASARVVRDPNGSCLRITEIGAGGEDGAAVDFPPALSLSTSVGAGGDGTMHFQPITDHDILSAFLLPYIEQDNLLRQLRFGLKGAAEGWAGAGAEANLTARVAAWRDGVLVHSTRLDSMSEMGETESLSMELGPPQANGIIAILIGLLVPAPGKIEIAYDLRPVGKSMVIMPDPGIVADRIVVAFGVEYQDGDAAPGVALTGVEVTAGFMDYVDICDLATRRGALASGRAHAALGQALLGEAVEGGVLVSNLGQGGEDGVRVESHYGDAGASYNAEAFSVFLAERGTTPESFTSRFGIHLTHDGTSNTLAAVGIATEKVERGFALALLRDPAGADGEGGGAGLLSSPLGLLATRSLPSEVRIGRGGIEFVYEEEVSFVPAEGGAERRGRRILLEGLWEDEAELEAVEIHAAGIDSFRVLARDEPPASERFRRGDADQSGTVELTDAVATLSALFLGQFEVRCLDAADSNDDGEVSIADPINTLSTLFLGKGAIPVPGFKACGVDPTEDGLGCQAQDACR